MMGEAIKKLVDESNNEDAKKDFELIKNCLAQSYFVMEKLAKDNISSHKARRLARTVLGIKDE